MHDDNSDALDHYLSKVEAMTRASTKSAASADMASSLSTSIGACDTALISGPPSALVDARQALHFAAATGRLRICRQLLQAGASVHARDHYGFTPLFGAVRGGHVDVVKLLHETGAHLRLEETALLLPVARERSEVQLALQAAQV